MRLTGKVAVITGGASGIGLATTKRFLVEGAKVVVGDVDEEALAALPEGVVGVRCDVRQEADVEALCAEAVNRFNGLDIAFANAGVGTGGPIVDADPAEWMRVIEVNLLGPMLTIKHAARRMADGGAIVVTASLNAVQPGTWASAYCSSKAGVAMLTKVAAMELGPAGIRVNAVGPGLVRTPLTEPSLLVPGLKDEYDGNAVLRVDTAPEEVAGLVTYLVSDEAASITGHLHLIDRGAHTKCYPDIMALLDGAG